MKIWIILFIIPLVVAKCSPEIKYDGYSSGFECRFFGCVSTSEKVRLNFEFKPDSYDWRTIVSSVVGEACSFVTPGYTFDDSLSELHFLGFKNPTPRQYGKYKCTLFIGKTGFQSDDIEFHGSTNVSSLMPTPTESTSSNTTDEQGTCPEIKAIEHGLECWFGCTSIGEVYRVNFEFKPYLYDWRTIASSVVGEACTFTSPGYTHDGTLSQLHLLCFQNQTLRQNGVYRCTLVTGKEEFHSNNVKYFHGTVSTPMPTATESTSSNTTDEQSTAVLTDSSSTSMPTQTESTSSNTPDKQCLNITSSNTEWFGIGFCVCLVVVVSVSLIAILVYKWKGNIMSKRSPEISYSPMSQNRRPSTLRTNESGQEVAEAQSKDGELRNPDLTDRVMLMLKTMSPAIRTGFLLDLTNTFKDDFAKIGLQLSANIKEGRNNEVVTEGTEETIIQNDPINFRETNEETRGDILEEIVETRL